MCRLLRCLESSGLEQWKSLGDSLLVGAQKVSIAGCGISLLREAAMDYANFHVVYVDSRVSRDLDGRLIESSSPGSAQDSTVRAGDPWDNQNPEYLKTILGEIEEVRNNLKSLLSVFNGGEFCPFLL